MAEIANILQADTPSGSSQVILFIPSKDREGHEVGTVIDGIYYGFTQF